jgi:signal transduction histidine kinase
VIRRGRSVLGRILWLHAVAVVATAIVVASAVYLFLDSTADRLQRETLLAHAETLAAGLSHDEGGVRLSVEARGAIERGGSSFAWFVSDPEGRTLAQRPGLRATFAGAPRQQTTTYFRRYSRQALISGVSMPLATDKGSVWIVVLQNLEHPDVIFDDVVRQFLLWGAVLIGAVLLLLLAVDVLIFRRALRPVNAASAHVQSLDTDDLDVRVPSDDLPLEVRPLAIAVNQALDRVARGYRTQQEFIADAAHELRTPLAVARMRVATIDAPEAAALQRDLDVMGRIVGQLLDIAATESARSPMGEIADLVEVATDAVAGMAPIAIGGGHMLSLEAGAARVEVRGSAQLIARALDALIENALQHSPAGTHVRVGVTPNGILSVADDGPGVPVAQRELVFRRFWRGDRSRADRSGLGLAIVARVARVHGGTVECVETPGGGATFVMRFSRHPGPVPGST